MSFFSGLISQPSSPHIIMPTTPSPTSTEADLAAQEAAKKQAEALKKRRGAAATILSGPEGILSPAVTRKATLLSGE